MKTAFVQIIATGSLLLLLSFSNSPAVKSASDASQWSGLNSEYFGGAYLKFAGKFGGEITPNEISNQRSVVVDGCAAGSRIFEFTLDITKGDEKISLETNSEKLTSEMLSTLKNLSPGDEFEFRNAKAYLPNGKDVVKVMSRKYVVV